MNAHTAAKMNSRSLTQGEIHEIRHGVDGDLSRSTLVRFKLPGLGAGIFALVHGSSTRTRHVFFSKRKMGADSTVLRGVAGVYVVLGDVCGCGCMRVHGVGVGECAWRVVGAVGVVVGGTRWWAARGNVRLSAAEMQKLVCLSAQTHGVLAAHQKLVC